ncbi:MAG: hypothetical protein IKU52_03315 [Clostridia bacterium]|nr:hypothetical protein [Clostridia bacterium]
MIYKGCERKMIMIKNTGCEYFDEVYFILKEKRNYNNIKEDDMLKEANRIVNENLISFVPQKKKKTLKTDLFSFCAGVFSGLFTASLVFMLIK